MLHAVFLTTTGQAIARAETSSGGNWSVTTTLSDQKVLWLAYNPQFPQVVSAGMQHAPLCCVRYALITDHNAPGHIYAGLSNGEV